MHCSVGNYIGKAAGSGDVRETFQVEYKSIKIQWITESMTNVASWAFVVHDDSAWISEEIMNRFVEKQ
jgi:hypothetical protein